MGRKRTEHLADRLCFAACLETFHRGHVLWGGVGVYLRHSEDVSSFVIWSLKSILPPNPVSGPKIKSASKASYEPRRMVSTAVFPHKQWSSSPLVAPILLANSPLPFSIFLIAGRFFPFSCLPSSLYHPRGAGLCTRLEV